MKFSMLHLLQVIRHLFSTVQSFLIWDIALCRFCWLPHYLWGLLQSRKLEPHSLQVSAFRRNCTAKTSVPVTFSWTEPCSYLLSPTISSEESRLNRHLYETSLSMQASWKYYILLCFLFRGCSLSLGAHSNIDNYLLLFFSPNQE